MAKTSQMQIRLDDQLKTDAESILSQIGLSPTEYLRMSLRQLVMRKGIPFDARVFNDETIAALNEDVSANKRYYGSDAFDDMMKDITTESD
jgi:DNA-damage-inducible protein J